MLKSLQLVYSLENLAALTGRAALEARIDAKLREACKLEGAGRYTFGRTVIDEKCVADVRIAALAEVERVAAAEARAGRAVAAN